MGFEPDTPQRRIFRKRSMFITAAIRERHQHDLLTLIHSRLGARASKTQSSVFDCKRLSSAKLSFVSTGKRLPNSRRPCRCHQKNGWLHTEHTCFHSKYFRVHIQDTWHKVWLLPCIHTCSGPKQQQFVSTTSGSPKVTFSGWARMALPITSTSIDEVYPFRLIEIWAYPISDTLTQ